MSSRTLQNYFPNIEILSGCCTAAWDDMNRSHNTNPLAYYTDDRNRTNHNAPEVVNLENFVSQHKSGSGQNVLLDVHGWENSTLGDSTVSKYFDNALGLNHVSNSGSDGYLIKWGMQNGINSTLVELPLPANPQDVINRNLSGKFISAVNNLLANTGVPASSTSAPEGWLDVVDGDHIAGWARDRNNLADSIWVHIYIRNRSTGQVTKIEPALANIYRGDVAPGSHGFNYAVDWRTIPPGDYQIETYAIGQNDNNPPLSGTPKYYTVNASNGCVDYVDSRGVGGWAWKSAAPNLPIDAHVYVYDLNGNYLYGVPVTANQYRSDLASLKYGNGYHGFSASIPWGSLPMGQLKVVVYAVDGSGNNPSFYTGYYQNNVHIKQNNNSNANSGYDRKAAYNYMMTYGKSNDYGASSTRNPYYKDVGDDCTSFVSQCLADPNAGKLPMVRFTSGTEPELSKLDPTFWFYSSASPLPNQYDSCSLSWSVASQFRVHWAGLQGLNMQAYRYIEYRTIDDAINDFDNLKNILQTGDIIQVINTQNEAHHSMIVQLTTASDILYAEHQGSIYPDGKNLSLRSAMNRWKTTTGVSDNHVGFFVIAK